MLDKLNSDEVSVVLFLFKVSVKLPTGCKTFYSVSYKHVSVKEGRVKKIKESHHESEAKSYKSPESEIQLTQIKM